MLSLFKSQVMIYRLWCSIRKKPSPDALLKNQETRHMAKRSKHIPVILLALFVISGCQGIQDRLPWATKSKKVIIAQIFDKFLYMEDFRSMLPTGTNPEDSLRLAKSFIDQWLKKQLLLDKAQLNLTPEELDIARQIEDYRSALLIYRYQDQMVKAKLDTILSEQEIQRYYDQHQMDFSLPENLYQVTYLKIPLSLADLPMIRNLLKSGNEEDRNTIIQLGNYPGARTTHYQGEWIPLAVLQKELPSGTSLQESLITKKEDLVELESDGFVFFFYIQDIIFKENTPPLSYVKPAIKDFILSQRKVEFLTHLENELYQDGLKKNLFKIPNPKP